MRLHVLDLLEDAVDDLLRGLARVLVPVVGVDLVADDDVAEILDAIDGSSLVVGVGLLVDRVGRAEVERLHAKLGGEEPFREIEFEVHLAVWDFRDVRMRPGVVADLMAFAIDPPHEAGVVAGGLADHEEGALYVELFEDVEDLRRPLGIRAVVEAQGNFVGVVTVLLHRVGEWVRVHLFLGDHVVIVGERMRRHPW